MAEQDKPATEAAPMRIYPMGLHRRAKEAVLGMVPEGEKREEARGLLRTGEENAVIFASISRKAGTFDTVAKEIDEAGAAKFHEKWTVSVEGYGHSSVGEHAIIQLAVENVSSADGDEVTDNRLASFTEFSARFSGRQTMSYFTPKSVQEEPRLAAIWHQVHGDLFAACDRLTSLGVEWLSTDEAQSAFPELRPGYYSDEGGEKELKSPNLWKSRLRKHGADQFKNMLPGSRLTSMAVTWNATEAEGAIRKFASSPSASVREMGRGIKEAALMVAPTLVKYADFTPYLASSNLRRDAVIKAYGLDGWMGRQSSDCSSPTSVVNSNDTEALILAGFLFESNKTGFYGDLVSQISMLPTEAKKAMFEAVLKDEVSWHDFEHGLVVSNGLTSHDKSPRAFELDGGNLYEMPSMTYGDWRDYKRHRPQTYIAKPLDIKWGYAIPPLARILDGSENRKYHESVESFRYAIEDMEHLYEEVLDHNAVDARYAVTRAHFRPAVAHFNPREAFHLLRLRTGDTAHPSVRQLMWKNVDVFRENHPEIASHIIPRGERAKIAFP
jgi:thymidylate synthase ThyX